MKAAVYYGPRDVRVETVPGLSGTGRGDPSGASLLRVCTDSASLPTDKKTSFRHHHGTRDRGDGR